MQGQNYIDRVKLYLRSNPALTYDDICVLLLIESIYTEIPEDLKEFKENYPHLDPKNILEKSDRITFIKIANSKNPTFVIKHRLNSYIDIKLNNLEHSKSYEKNMELFKEYSIEASKFLDDILKIGDFPPELIDILKEQKEIKECYDIYELLNLFKDTNNFRTRYEIIRKIGLIILLSRIRKTFEIETVQNQTNAVWKVFGKGLNIANNEKRAMYFWLDEDNKVVISDDKAMTEKLYQTHRNKRVKLAEKIFPVQSFFYHPFKTPNGNNILNINIRNKFFPEGVKTYTSTMEKIIRKNLQFPNQIHDMIGIKMIVSSENDFQGIVEELEGFIGGTSTRKREKNSYHKFGRKKLNKYSAKEFYVWKAVYDISLEHHNVPYLRKLIELTANNKEVHDELKRKYEHYLNHPKDCVVEVQLQDLETYLQSIAKGSASNHEVLKKHQIRRNSFYKIFPKEIYEKELLSLKLKLLNSININLDDDN